MVFIIDDHADTRALIAHFLTSHGYESMHADSATEALRLMQTQIPELILLDYTMPDMDGLKLLRVIKREARLADVPVIGLSAHGGYVGQLMVTAGADLFYQKGNIDWDELASEMSRLMGKGPASTSAASGPA
jgi:CheY-like chemotaxis protein